MDEGSIADDVKFRKYFKRFVRIFNIPFKIKTFYTPGDNDIGGEWPEPIDELKVERFKKYFGDQNLTKLNENIKVFNVNLITSEIPILDDSDNLPDIFIFMSHYPVVHRTSSASFKIVKSLVNKSSVIFSAHDHESLEIVANISTLSSRSFPLTSLKVFDLEAIKRRNKILEIKVPSCSYRMGTLTIGFGQAIFDNGEMKYSPLFVISRFYQLGFYVIFVLILLVLNACLRNKRSRVS